MGHIKLLPFLLILAFAIHAEERCPPGKNQKQHTGTNGTLTWTSSQIETPSGICFERRVVVKGDTYVNWPAASINKTMVHLSHGNARCCFQDSTTTNADLEYGLLGAKIRTTVYQGANEVAQANSFGFDRSVHSGKEWLPVGFHATAYSFPGDTCKEHGETCRSVWYTVKSEGSPVTLRWNSTITPRFEFVRKAGLDGGEFVLPPGRTISLEFVMPTEPPAKPPRPTKAPDDWIMVMMPDGANSEKLPALVPK